jgi:hypothetical protein
VASVPYAGGSAHKDRTTSSKKGKAVAAHPGCSPARFKDAKRRARICRA